MLSRLLTLPAGRRAKWIVLVVWLVAVVLLASYSSKLNSVSSNDPGNFTPSGAESSQVSDLDLTVFPNGQQTAAIVVFHRASGLTAADLAVMRKDFAYFTSHPPQHTAPPVWGGPPSDPRSPDHKVATFSMAVLSVNQDTVKAAVDTMRQHLSLGTGGLDIRVTGPAGLLDDIMGLVSSIGGLVLGATLLLVLVLLLLIYRSPLLALLPIVTVALAYTVAGGLVYLLAKNAGLTLNGEAGFLLPVLMFGAGTDYSLLLINRYREELHRNADKHVAMAETLRTESPAVLSSGSTVLVAMLVLLLASLRSTHNFGPVLAIGIGVALLAGLTLLPALLQIVGRPAFWPMIPRVEPERVKASGLWAWVARTVSTHTGTVLVGTLVLLVLLGLGATTISEQQNELNSFRSPSQGTEGFSYIQASLPAGLLAPTSIVVQPASAEPAVWKAALAVPGVLDAHLPPVVGKGGYVQMFVVFKSDPYGQQAMNTVTALRSALHAAAPPGATVLVGGVTAVTLDTLNASNRDIVVIAPAVLLVILVILCLLLRAVVAPVLLIATVVLSFFASLGVSVLVFTHVFGFQGIDPGLPILLFIFLVALGVDYNIFLMSRVREEAERYGTREGVMRGLTTTGSVITSAGIILAGTFSVLITLPSKQLIDIGFAVAFGVLFDTVVVRSFLVPSLILTVGDLSWWPSRLATGQVRQRPVAAAGETVVKGSRA